jgi:hypothetical protein
MSDVGTLPTMRSLRALDGYVLEIRWDSGLTTMIELADMVSTGGVFAFLRDEKNFKAVKLGARRRSVEWVDPADSSIVDLDADTLLQMGQDQSFFRRFARALGQQPSS